MTSLLIIALLYSFQLSQFHSLVLSFALLKYFFSLFLLLHGFFEEKTKILLFLFLLFFLVVNEHFSLLIFGLFDMFFKLLDFLLSTFLLSLINEVFLVDLACSFWDSFILKLLNFNMPLLILHGPFYLNFIDRLLKSFLELNGFLFEFNLLRKLLKVFMFELFLELFLLTFTQFTLLKLTVSKHFPFVLWILVEIRWHSDNVKKTKLCGKAIILYLFGLWKGNDY